MNDGANDVLRTILSSLAQPVLDPGSRTFWPWLIGAALLAAALRVRATGRDATGWSLAKVRWGSVLHAIFPYRWLREPSGQLDLQLLVLRRLIAVARAGGGASGAYLLGTRLVMLLDRAVGAPTPPALPGWALTLIYSLSLFLSWDLSRFLLHRLMHRAPALWAFHEVHHSATRLTPLTFHRTHPIESLLYDLRGVLATGVVAGLFYWAFRGAAAEHTLLGVHSIGLVLNALTGNLRHSAVFVRFPAAVERWLLSPAQHQLHHSADPAHHDANYGTWLAVWDRAAGTLLPSPPAPIGRFGVPGARHEQRLSSALLSPFRVAAASLSRPARAGILSLPVFSLPALSLLWPGPARADEASAPDDEDAGGTGESIVVTAPDGTPRVAGSAHVVSEAELERFEYTDIHKVLAKIPGVTIRVEDGFGLRPNIGIRGVDSDRSSKILLLEDGLPLAPAPYAAPAAYYFPLTQRVVGVEVFKGATAIRQGPQTIAGAVNLLTRPVGPRDAAALDVAVGPRDTQKLHGWVNVRAGDLGLLLEGAHLGTGGFKQLDTGGETGFSRDDLMAKAELRLPGLGAGRQRAELKLGWGQEESRETYLGLTLDDFEADPLRRYSASADDLMQWDRTAGSLRYHWTHPHVRAELSAYGALLDRTWLRFDGLGSGVDVNEVLTADLSATNAEATRLAALLAGEADSASSDENIVLVTNDRRFRSGGVQARLTHTAGGTAWGSELELGVRLHGDQVLRDHTAQQRPMAGGRLQERVGPLVQTTDSDATARALSLHLAEDLRLGPVHLLPGLRMEQVHIRLDDALVDDPAIVADIRTLLPGAGALWSATPWLDLFGAAHRGSSPVPPGSPEGTKPELANNFEAGLRLSPRATRVELVGFWSAYDNLTGQCTLSGGCADAQLDQQFNGGEADVWGAEGSLHQELGLPGKWLLVGDLAGTWTESAFRTGFVSALPRWGTVEPGDALPYLPQLQGTAGLSAVHPRVNAALSATGRSAQRDIAGQGVIPDDERLPGVVTLDAALHGQLRGPLWGYMTVNNVLNTIVMESLRPYGARPSAPRQLMVGITLTSG